MAEAGGAYRKPGEVEPTPRCAACKEELEGPGAPSPLGPVCKWCQSEQQVKAQQARPPAPSPAFVAPARRDTGLSTITILRIVFGLVALFFAFARHC